MKKNLLPPVICIVGPTASGKTEASVRVAEKFDCEIVSADSMQVYKGMDIGTAKPDLAERRGIPHWMFDVCLPGESMSVVKYARMARRCCDDIIARGKLPLIVGGTGQYVNAVIRDENFAPEPQSAEIRRKYEDIARCRGADELHRILAQKDPESALRIHANNVKRVVRALEIIELTGKTVGEVYAMQPAPREVYDAVMVCLCPEPRELLYSRIDRRVDVMLADGLMDEVLALAENGFSETSIQAIGYKELFPVIEGVKSLSEAADDIRRRSRNYAKRQLTWFRADSRIEMLTYSDSEGYGLCVERICQLIEEKTGEVFKKCRNR
ncbi:MAG: tRNA (adenosine(37)-N6)-dimethylallyltransferase MiaA [Clostridia bacterium]|nr:tRNA (adenosine(37)-N6)-dimethylallyltransferase MiaA [Clostridia bacterium]